MRSSKAKHQPSLSNFLIFTISKFQIMKKTYIQPQAIVEFAQCEMLIAASMLDVNSDSQSITPSNEDYDDEFFVKEYFGDDF